MTRYFQGITICFCFLLATFCACVSYGQPFKLLFHHLSPNEGLSQGTNAFVYQDSKGFIWLSSTDGVNRFDGKTVKIYRAPIAKGLLDNFIVSTFFEDEKTELGFDHFEGRSYIGLMRHQIITAVTHLFLARTQQAWREKESGVDGLPSSHREYGTRTILVA